MASVSVAVAQEWTDLSDAPRSFAVAGVSADAFVKMNWADWRFVLRLISVRMLEQALEHPPLNPVRSRTLATSESIVKTVVCLKLTALQSIPADRRFVFCC